MLSKRKIRISESDFYNMIVNLVEEATYKILNEDIVPTTAGNGSTSGSTGNEMSGHSGVADGVENKEETFGQSVWSGLKDAGGYALNSFKNNYLSGTIMDPHGYNGFNKNWDNGHYKSVYTKLRQGGQSVSSANQSIKSMGYNGNPFTH